MAGVSLGVSPAFFLSLYGTGFTARDVCDALPLVKSLGFSAFQVELFSQDKLDHWLAGGAKEVREAAEANGLAVSASVAHFLLAGFGGQEALFRYNDEKAYTDFLRASALVCPGGVVSMPLGPYAGVRTASALARLGQKLGHYADLAKAAGLRPVLEIQPGALVCEPRGLRALLEETGCGLNLDTGHTFAAGQPVLAYPAIFAGDIQATHLCDNDGKKNDSLRPGTGGIDFAALIQGLAAGGYTGSYDLEIFTRKEDVEREYARGLASLRGWLEDCGVPCGQAIRNSGT